VILHEKLHVQNLCSSGMLCTLHACITPFKGCDAFAASTHRRKHAYAKQSTKALATDRFRLFENNLKKITGFRKPVV
jgi:hypothetical protein